MLRERSIVAASCIRQRHDRAYQAACDLGGKRVADLIVFWHTQPGRKLRGLVALLQSGKTVWFDADKGLIIDDSLSDFDALEKGGV